MQIVADQDNSNQRFDRFMRKYCKIYPEVKLGDIYSWIRKGQVKVNGKKTKEDYKVRLGDKIELFDDVLGKKDLSVLIAPKVKKLAKVKKADIKKMIVFEDQNWIVFDKPSGIVIHESNRHRNDLTMNDYLEKYLDFDINTEYSFRPSFGYRLDKDTSGVLIAAKNYDALQYINEVIRDRKMDKKYLTIVVGKFPQHIIINKSLDKKYDKQFDRSHMVVDKSGVKAVSECWNKKTFFHPDLGTLSLVEVKIETGRMHQIRVHLASEDFPVLGDIIYGSPVVNRILYKKYKINRQLLHCAKYSFTDIGAKKKNYFEAPMPEDFDSIIKLNGIE